jgi:hypothetical protein
MYVEIYEYIHTNTQAPPNHQSSLHALQWHHGLCQIRLWAKKKEKKVNFCTPYSGTMAYAKFAYGRKKKKKKSIFVLFTSKASKLSTWRWHHVGLRIGPPCPFLRPSNALEIPAYVSIRQHTSAYVSIRQHTAAYGSIRQHTAACVRVCFYADISSHTYAVARRMLTYADVC